MFCNVTPTPSQVLNRFMVLAGSDSALTAKTVAGQIRIHCTLLIPTGKLQFCLCATYKYKYRIDSDLTIHLSHAGQCIVVENVTLS